MRTIVGKDIKKVKKLLENGDIAAIPTETVYGKAANALDARAVEKIFEAKERHHFDTLIVRVRSNDAINEYSIELTEWAKKLAAKVFTGHLQLFLNKKALVTMFVYA